MKKFSNKKKIILGSIIGVLVGTLLSVSYAAYTYNRTGLNNKLIVGDIYMRYKESSNTINFQDAMPRESYVAGQYFEFDIVGKNTYTEKDIIYDIVLNYGDAHETRTTRIKDELLRFRLVEVVNNEEQEIFTDRQYVSINNVRIHKATIPASTNSEITHRYRLYAWISNDTIIGNTSNADYSMTEWDDVYASVKVNVTGDFYDKKVPDVLYDIVRTGATSDSGIHFYEVNGTDNGNGKFVRNTTTSDTYPIYYYRGNVDNNNVIFANKCWKIVRTTETGGTKMIYNGEISTIKQYTNYGRDIYTNVERTGNQFEFDTTTNEWKVTLTVPESGDNSGEAKITFQIATPGTYKLRYTIPNSGPVTLNRGSTSFGSSGINQAVTLENVTASETFTIAFRYYNAPNAQTDVIFSLLESEIDTGEISCDNEGTSSQLPSQAFNSSYQSPAYVGYNYGTTAYEYSTANWTSGAKFGSSYTWNGTSYTLVDATETTPNATHHYSCNATNSDATCSDLRYVYYMGGSTKYYITLQNGKGVEDALKEMLSESTDTIKSPIHETVNNWYNTNIKNSYGTYVEDTAWCNDRSIGSLGGWNPNGGALTGSSLTDYSLLFSSYTRYQNPTGTNGIQTTNSPVLTCSNPNDVMSVANRKLENPVALLTYDEANLAGLIYNSSNNSNYLLTGNYYWLLSPTSFLRSNADVGVVGISGNLDEYNVYSANGDVRPALSLKHGTLVYDGDGSVSNPYIVGTPRT